MLRDGSFADADSLCALSLLFSFTTRLQVLIVRKSQQTIPSPCRNPSSQLKQLLPMMSFNAHTNYPSRLNVLDAYKVLPVVTIPCAPGHGKEADRGHLVVFHMSSHSADHAVRRDYYGEACADVLHYHPNGLLDLAVSAAAAWKKIVELEELEECSQQEQRFLAASKSKTAKHREGDRDDASDASTVSDAGSQAHSAARAIAARATERARTLAMAILARFFQIDTEKKLLVLDACSGSGSVASAMLMLKGMGVNVGCLSLDNDPLIVSYAQEFFQSELLKFYERIETRLSVGDVQNNSEMAKVARDATANCSGTKVSTT